MSAPEPAPRPAAGDDEPPPRVGSWNRLYALVLVELALTILLLALITRSCR